jgi:hypothetical protein
MTEPAQHPPQARRIGAGPLIVGDDLLRRIDTDAAEDRSGGVRCRQRMPAVRSRLRSREVAIHVHETRPGNVRAAVLRLAPGVRLPEIVTHVDDDERRIV